jgi:predicted nucleic acid-binding protein
MSETDVPVDFFDTSALIKHYAEEIGTGIIDRAFDAPDTRRIITDITIIEFHSAFARRMRMGQCDAETFEGAKSELAADIADGHLEVEPLTEADKADAIRLIEQHGASRGLRTLDALQLAVMNRLGSEALQTIYCADRVFVAILEAEGFTVIDPEAPPSELSQ